MAGRLKKLGSVTMAIWRAQGRACAICGDRMVPVHAYHHARGWSVEHVWPRARYHFEHEGNQLISHLCCNNAKADRDPTGCEQIMLAAVNARLGFQLAPRPLVHVLDQVSAPSALASALAASGLAIDGTRLGSA